MLRFRRTEQPHTANSTSAMAIERSRNMETRDHSNGVSPKNQRSRGNFLIVVCFALLVASITFVGCQKDNDKLGAKKNHFTSPEEYIENPSVSDALNESGVPVYGGNNPPALAGTYSTDGKITDASHEMSSMIGTSINTEIVLSKQTTSGKIDIEERAGGIVVSGSGGYITGDDGYFTIYQESKQSGSEAGLPNDLALTVVLMMSGKKTSNGDLTGVQGISIITQATGNSSAYNLSAMEGLWWKWDAEFYLHKEKSTIFKSKADFSNPLFLHEIWKSAANHITHQINKN